MVSRASGELSRAPGDGAPANQTQDMTHFVFASPTMPCVAAAARDDQCALAASGSARIRPIDAGIDAVDPAHRRRPAFVAASVAAIADQSARFVSGQEIVASTRSRRSSPAASS